MNSAMIVIRTFPLLSQEGWDFNRWRAGVVPKRDIPREGGFGTTPRVNFLHSFNLLTASWIPPAAIWLTHTPV